MSGINGDKARFHRRRKHKIATRAQNRVRFQGLDTTVKPAAAPSDSKPAAGSRNKASE